jgi:nucleoside-diphosphate-sugar epimerase
LTREEDCARAIEGADIVYHLAAATSGGPADQILNSAVATRNLLNAIAASGREIRVIHCSSFGVYGVADLPQGSVVDESVPLEPRPELRDPYSHAKLRQEQIVWQLSRERGIPVAVLRPGVLYGPGGGAAISNRVGLRVFGVFLHLGRHNLLPLTFVDNCAAAFAVAGRQREALGEAFNVVDDDLITASEFLLRYRTEVERIPKVSLPWFATRGLTVALERYVEWSKGQLPPILTRYKANNAWRSHRFDNGKLKKLGWRPPVTTAEGLRLHFEYWATRQRGGQQVR